MESNSITTFCIQLMFYLLVKFGQLTVDGHLLSSRGQSLCEVNNFALVAFIFQIQLRREMTARLPLQGIILLPV